MHRRAHVNLKNFDIFSLLPSVSINSERESNTIMYLLCLYLSGSKILVSSTDSNKQLFNVKSVFKFLNQSKKIYIYICVWNVYLCIPYSVHKYTYIYFLKDTIII